MVYLYNEILFRYKKKIIIDILNNMNESQKHIWREKQKAHTNSFYLHEVQEQTKLIHGEKICSIGGLWDWGGKRGNWMGKRNLLGE